MIEPVKPPADIDALARRLPRRTISPDRTLAMREALLDAAELPTARSAFGGSVRRWIAAGAVAAAAAIVLIVWRTGAPAPRPPGVAMVPAAAVAPGSAPPVEPARTHAIADATAPRVAGDPLGPVGRLVDGLHAIDAERPLQLTRGGATITAPPGARFDVEVRDGQVERVAVKVGWVVIAGAHAASTMIVERQTWELPAAPAVPAPAPSPSLAPAPAPSLAPALTPTIAPTRTPPARPLAAAPAKRITPGAEAEAAPAAPPPAPAPPATSEQDFRDGLRALLTGDPQQAVAPLARACAAPSTSQMDICYWSAVAWQRSGDPARARLEFADVLARWPGSTHAGEANVALGWLLLDTGAHAAARARFAAAANDRVPSVRADAVRGLAATQ